MKAVENCVAEHRHCVSCGVVVIEPWPGVFLRFPNAYGGEPRRMPLCAPCLNEYGDRVHTDETSGEKWVV